MPVVRLAAASPDLQHAAAVVGVDERHGPCRRRCRRRARCDAPGNDHEGVAVGVAAAEVIEVDLVGALADRHLVLERALRPSPLPLFSLKIGIFSMLVFVFSCATTSTEAGNSTLPLT